MLTEKEINEFKEKILNSSYLTKLEKRPKMLTGYTPRTTYSNMTWLIKDSVARVKYRVNVYKEFF